MNKIKEFYLKNKTIIAMGVMTALVLLANFFYELWPIATAMLVFFFATSSFKEHVCYCVYMAVFSGVSPIYASCILLCLICVAVRYVVDVLKNRKQFFKLPFFVTTAIVVVFSLIFGKVDTNGFFNWGLFVGILYFVYFAYVYHEEIDVKKAFNFLFGAVLVSAVLGFSLLWVDALKIKTYPFDGTYNRLRLFTLNVNHLAMMCMFGIAFFVYEMFNNVIVQPKSFAFFKDKQFWFKLFKIAFLCVIGLMTLSKAFLLVLALVLVYVFVLLILKLKTKSLLIILPLMGAIAVLCLIFKDFVWNLLSRFVVYDAWESLLSKIFTGRTDIWITYINEIFSSPLKAIFGVGLLTQDVVAKGPHNVLIYLVYRVGFVGLVALCVLVWLYAKQSSKKIKPTILNCLLFLVYVVFALEEMIFSDRFFLFLIFAIILMLKNNEKIEENAQNIEKN